jgi:hypothetical protein
MKINPHLRAHRIQRARNSTFEIAPEIVSEVADDWKRIGRLPILDSTRGLRRA